MKMRAVTFQAMFLGGSVLACVSLIAGCGASAGDGEASDVGVSGEDLSGVMTVQSVHSGKCMDVSGRSLLNGGVVWQWSCVDVPNQKWQFNDQGNGVVEIVSVNSGKCLEVAGSSKVNGAGIDQSTCSGAANQRWKLSNTSGKYTFTSVNSGKCLDVTGAGTTNKVLFQQWTCGNHDSERFTLHSSTPPSGGGGAGGGGAGGGGAGGGGAGGGGAGGGGAGGSGSGGMTSLGQFVMTWYSFQDNTPVNSSESASGRELHAYTSVAVPFRLLKAFGGKLDYGQKLYLDYLHGKKMPNGKTHTGWVEIDDFCGDSGDDSYCFQTVGGKSFPNTDLYIGDFSKSGMAPSGGDCSGPAGTGQELTTVSTGDPGSQFMLDYGGADLGSGKCGDYTSAEAQQGGKNGGCWDYTPPTSSVADCASCEVGVSCSSK
jgi:hypothetical protein